MATIVILGAGIGGVPCAYELRKGRSGSVTPVDETDVLKALGVERLQNGPG